MKLLLLSSQKLWNSYLIVIVLLGIIVTFAKPQDLNERNAGDKTSLNDGDFRENNITNTTDRNNKRNLTPPTVIYNSSNVKNRTSTNNTESENNPNNTSGVLAGIVTTETYQNTSQTTEDSDTETKGTASPKFNFAIIAAIGILIVLTVLCLKCCGWFRAYTRAGDKEDSTQYAAILHTGDEEYGHIDIQSDTASTVYLDTVSSYQSFLKRNGNDSSMNSNRSSKFGVLRQNSGSPRKESGKPVLSDFDVRYMEMKQIRPSSRAETPDTCSPRSESATSDNVRTFSVSSEDTDPSNTALPLQNSDELINRKSQKFNKVSFTTDNSTGVSRLSLPRGITRSSFKQSSLERHKRTMSCRSAASRISDINDTTLRLQPLNQRIEEKSSDTMVDVSTQTNRSFTYSRWKSRKRHYSDSGVDETVGPPSIQELSFVCPYTDNCGHTCVSPKKRTHLSMNETCDINRNKSVVNQKNTENQLNREMSISGSESNDDVFATDVLLTVGIKDRDINNSCTCDVLSEKQYQPKLSNHINVSIPPVSPQYAEEKDSSKTSVWLDSSDVSSINETKSQKSDVLRGTTVDSCNDCDLVKSISGSNSKLRSMTSNCETFLVNDPDVIFDDRNDVHDTDISVHHVTCSEVNRNVNVIPVDVYKIKDGIAKLKDTNDDGHTLIIEQDLTSSMTSLESSGYAEISSDASTS